MEASAIIKIAEEVAGVINKVLDQLPTHDQRKMNEFYKFLDKYYTEVSRADGDTDDIVTWKKRKTLLTETIIKQIWEAKK